MTDYIKLGMKDEGVKVTFYKVEGGEGERHILKIKGMKNFLQIEGLQVMYYTKLRG